MPGFYCPICNCTHTSSTSFRRHLRSVRHIARSNNPRYNQVTLDPIHLILEPYICPLCGASYESKYNLHRHQRHAHGTCTDPVDTSTAPRPHTQPQPPSQPNTQSNTNAQPNTETNVETNLLLREILDLRRRLDTIQSSSGSDAVVAPPPPPPRPQPQPPRQWIYLIQLREFIHTSQPIYKIGKTRQPDSRRFRQYPLGSERVIEVESSNCDRDERDIIAVFHEKYIHKPELGTEFFEGASMDMIDDIYRIIRRGRMLPST